jgi:hypothetical protein
MALKVLLSSHFEEDLRLWVSSFYEPSVSVKHRLLYDNARIHQDFGEILR